MEYGLIGSKLGHSYSKIIHEMLCGYHYDLCPLPTEEEARAFLTRRQFKAINVTIPYKRLVMEYCTYIDPRAKAIGAVNTVVNKNGLLYGYNTDYLGFAHLCDAHGVDFAGKTVLILGTGGTHNTTSAVARDKGAARVLTVSRTPDAAKGQLSYEEAVFSGAQIVINTTPAGMYPNVGVCSLDVAKMPGLEAVLDVVYNPDKTELILRAEEAGVPVAVGGLEMLVAQAVYAAEYFLSRKFDDAAGEIGRITAALRRDMLNVTRVSAPYKRANRLFHPADSVIDCGGVKIGGKEKIAVMAGPCSIESEEQALRIAQGVKAGGATLFRGGAYKPRTSPYSFQGLETEGILDMVKAREATGMPIVSELMSEERIPEFEEYVDVVQIGARNMQNFQLLKAVGKMHKPVLLKRGLCNTIEEWIMSAEYIMAGGNEQVILCERGIRTFEKYTRNTLDLSAVPIIHEKTHLPVIVDPSHATGKANLVEPMMIAAVAAGADGLEVEVHYDPRHAWSDGAQCLTPDAFAQAMAKCRQVAWAIGRDM